MEMDDNISQKDQKFDEFAKKKPFSVFLMFRYAGMGLLFLSMVFLFQKGNAPLIKIKGMPIQNGPLGTIILYLGAALFLVYLIHKIYGILKRGR